MLSMLVLILSGGTVTCGDLAREVADLHRITFLDPSDRSRSEATSEFVRDVLVPQRSCSETGAGRCTAAAVEEVWTVADQEILRDGISAQLAAYDSCATKLFPNPVDPSDPVTRHSLGEINAGRAMSVWLDAPRQPVGDVWRARPSHERGTTPAALALTEVIRKHPTRQARLTAALHYQGKSDESAQIRKWAISELLGRDPRRWAAADVALAIRGYLTDTSRQSDLLQSLSRMGFANVARILPKETFNLPGIDRPYRSDWEFHLVNQLPEHFPREKALYLQEWFAAHPDEAVDPNLWNSRLPEQERRRRIVARNHFVEQQWLESDSLAPHPDLDLVSEELEKLKGARK